MIRLLSLDVSTTSTGYAVVRGDGKVVDSGTIAPKAKDWVDRALMMADFIRLLNTSYQFTHVVIEDTYVSKNVNTVKKLCLVQGMLFAHTEAKLIQIYPVSWKSYYGLTSKGMKRTEQKQKSLSIAETLANLRNKDSDDEADAVLIGKFIIENKEKYIGTDSGNF